MAGSYIPHYNNLGVGGVVLYTVTHFKKKELERKKEELQLQLKLAEAQVQFLAGDHLNLELEQAYTNIFIS